MLKHLKFLPALAVIASLAPFAANAWTGQVSGTPSAYGQTVQTSQATNQASQGRNSEFYPNATPNN